MVCYWNLIWKHLLTLTIRNLGLNIYEHFPCKETLDSCRYYLQRNLVNGAELFVIDAAKNEIFVCHNPLWL